MEEIRAIVSGRVQMVMYRDFTCRTARRWGIGGTVRNLSDGTVEVIAQGRREDLEQFIKRLKRGPLLARVAHVEVVWRHPTRTFDSFEIVY